MMRRAYREGTGDKLVYIFDVILCNGYCFVNVLPNHPVTSEQKKIHEKWLHSSPFLTILDHDSHSFAWCSVDQVP